MPSHDGAALLEARGLQRSFGRVRILHGLDLSLKPGEALAIIGPNGAGKTTLVRLLAGLIRPSAGEVHILGQRLGGEVGSARRQLGVLLHQSLLYDDLTLLENLTLAARLYTVAAAALDEVGLSDRAGDLPRRLSRGLLQRAAIARALLHAPKLLLLDEPFTGLDTPAAARLRTELQRRLAQGLGLVIVTHHLAEVWDLASRIAVLIEGQWAIDEQRSGALEAFLPRYRELIGA
jgi:heme exporter protein A